MQAIFFKNGIEFAFNPGQEAKLISCEPSELSEVIVNLLNNSIEALANTTEPRIEISLEEDSTHIHLIFSDNGPGIKPELCQKIFTAFFTTKQGKASAQGLGLSIAQKIARSYGGDIVLEPARGNSCFNVSLSKECIKQQKATGSEELKKVS